MLKRILISLSVLGVLALFSCNAAYADPSVPVATPIGVEDKAIEVIDKVVNGITEIQSKYGAQAGALVLETVRMKSLDKLFIGLFCLLMLIGNVPLWRAANKYAKSSYSEVYFPCAMFTFISAIFFLPGLVINIGAPTWYGLFKPEVVLAADVLDKILK